MPERLERSTTKSALYKYTYLYLYLPTFYETVTFSDIDAIPNCNTLFEGLNGAIQRTLHSRRHRNALNKAASRY